MRVVVDVGVKLRVPTELRETDAVPVIVLVALTLRVEIAETLDVREGLELLLDDGDTLVDFDIVEEAVLVRVPTLEPVIRLEAEADLEMVDVFELEEVAVEDLDPVDDLVELALVVDVREALAVRVLENDALGL